MVVALSMRTNSNDDSFNKQAFLLLLGRARKFAAKHAVEHPLALAVAILVLSSCGLPLVTMVSLSPLVLLSNCAGYISDLGIESLLYYVMMQGSSLVFLVVTLSVITYSAIVSVNLMNSIVNSSYVQKKFLKKQEQ